MIFGDVKHLWYVNNVDSTRKELLPGFYGLSNALLDSSWPKLVTGKKEFIREVSSERLDIEVLFSMMENPEQAPVDQLPSTGVPFELEQKLSAKFIKMDHYGTRCTSLLTIDKAGMVNFMEKSFYPKAVKSFDFQIPT